MNLARERSLRRVVRRAVAVLLFLLVLEYLVVPQLAGARSSLRLLADVNVALLAAAVLAEVAAILAYAELTRSVLPGASAPSLRRTAEIGMATLAVSHLVPGGAAAGTGLGLRLLVEEGVTAADAGFGLAAQGLGSALVLNAMLWVALVASIPTHGFNPLYVTATAVGAVLIGGFSAIVVLLTRGEARASRLVRWVARHVPFLDEEAVHRGVHRVAARLRALAADRRLLARASGWAAANWLLDAACLWIFLVAFGRTVDPLALLVSYGLAYVLAAIPITPGGLGVVEAVLSASLVGFGVPKAVALVGVVTYRLVNFWLPIPVGAISYVSLRSGREERRGRREQVSAIAYEAAADREEPREWALRHGIDIGHRHHPAGADEPTAGRPGPQSE